MGKIIIVGAGPTGLMAGYQLLLKGYQVVFYDHKKAPGRKFLVAGHGGFNLTNSEKKDVFISRYNHPFIQNAVVNFSNEDTVKWLSEIDIETFTGTSGRIFPLKSIKPITVLNNWIERIQELGGEFNYGFSLVDWSEGKVHFTQKENEIIVEYDKLVLCLGGGSWKKTGSTGVWMDLFRSKGIETVDFEPSNSGVELEGWQDAYKNLIFKNCKITIGNQHGLGEIATTSYGMEGGVIYAMSNQIRFGVKQLEIDFKPSHTKEKLVEYISNSELNITESLRKLKVSKDVIRLLKLSLTKEQFNDVTHLATVIKGYIFNIKGLRPIDEVISTVGGVQMNMVDKSFRLKQAEDIYLGGEMLNWDAPTGGYLLQACFSMGVAIANGIVQSISPDEEG